MSPFFVIADSFVRTFLIYGLTDEIVAGLKTALSTSTEVVYTPLPLKADPASASGLSAERATMTSASTSSPTQSQSQSRSEHQGGEQSNDVTRDELKTNSVTSTSTSTSSYELRPDVILYVGGESLALTNLLMTHAGSSVRTQTYFFVVYSHDTNHRYTHTTPQRILPASNQHKRTNSSCDDTQSSKKHEMQTCSGS